jgi:hypothetical protein
MRILELPEYDSPRIDYLHGGHLSLFISRGDMTRVEHVLQHGTTSTQPFDKVIDVQVVLKNKGADVIVVRSVCSLWLAEPDRHFENIGYSVTRVTTKHWATNDELPSVFAEIKELREFYAPATRVVNERQDIVSGLGDINLRC